MLGWAEWGLGSYAYAYMFSNSYDRSQLHHEFDGFFWGGLGFDIGGSFLISAIGYTYLALKWEGYQRHNYYKCLHLATIIFVSMIPHGDFLL